MSGAATGDRPADWRPEWRRKGERQVLKAPAVDVGPCPDPASPDAARLIHAAAYRRLWAVIAGPDTTPQDVIAAYAATRLAARVGADRVPTKRPRLRLGSILPDAPSAGPGP